MTTQIFINLPVKNLERSINFFTSLGFAFNTDYTDENGTCMILNETTNVMFLVEKFFKTFTPRPVAVANDVSEVIVTLSADSRENVDQTISQAIQAGGMDSGTLVDEGWMYARGFQDLDGHLWEIMSMDESAMGQAPGG